MRLRPLSREEVRAIDRRAIEELHLPSLALMENAGHGVARWLVELGIDGPVVVCCGKGNNGGDGFVTARHLDGWGYSVRVLSLADPAELRGDAAVNAAVVRAGGIAFERWDPAQTHSEVLRGAAWLVDALVGTGTHGEVTGPIRSAIDALNGCPARKLAIDIPSGLDCDTGRPLGAAVVASHTATLVSRKLGFSATSAGCYTGSVRVIDIGLPACLLREFATSDDPA